MTPSKVASRARSAQFRSGQRGCRRLRDGDLVAQDAKISAVFRASARQRCSHATSRVIRRKAQRRHMTGDHHGRAVGTATLVLTALDGDRHAHWLRALPAHQRGILSR